MILFGENPQALTQLTGTGRADMDQWSFRVHRMAGDDCDNRTSQLSKQIDRGQARFSEGVQVVQHVNDTHLAVFGAQLIGDQPEQKSAGHRQEKSQSRIEPWIGPRSLWQQEGLAEGDGRPEDQHHQACHYAADYAE